MRHRLLDLLACPECSGFPLEMTVLAEEAGAVPQVQGTVCRAHCALRGEAVRPAAAYDCANCYAREITEAILTCRGCGMEYPVIEGIPRFNPDVAQDYPEFFQRHASRFQSAARREVAGFHALHKETKHSFGFQWLNFKVTVEDGDRALFFRRTRTDRQSLAGRLLFEAGCGMGRYLRVIGETPDAEVVGLDLSLAVNRARSESRHNPRVHVIQGNIMELPLRPGAFDHVYSIGVLHHTPNTKDAFRSIVPLAKPGGRVSIWVYHVWHPPYLHGLRAVHATVKGWITDGLRVITTRLPVRLLRRLCYVAAPLGWLQRKIVAAPLPLRVLFSPLLLVNCSQNPQWEARVLDTFDWYSPRFQWKHTVAEVEGWFREAGLEEIDSEGFPVSVRGRKAAGAVAGQTAARAGA